MFASELQPRLLFLSIASQLGLRVVSNCEVEISITSYLSILHQSYENMNISHVKYWQAYFIIEFEKLYTFVF